MKSRVDVWLRGTDFAKTTTFDGPPRPPAEWTDEDVQQVLGSHAARDAPPEASRCRGGSGSRYEV